MATRHWLQLSLTPGIGPVLIRRIVARAGSVEAACAATGTLLREVEGIGSAKASAVVDGLRLAAGEVDAELGRAASAGVTILCPDDATYPALLREIPDPPAALYVRGALEPRDLHAVAIVGSRRCSLYGREQAERFAALLAGAGVTVVSGGARGIDSAAHRGAMQPLNGRTIAVLGSGVDVPYPPENEPLFRQIATEGRGAVLSEYPLGTPPVAENFPRRNRLISGLSRGVLVVEADLRSGALITARQAVDDHGRTVFALPGRVDSPTSAGPHQLIRDGATLVTSLDDILHELGPLPASVDAPAVQAPAGPLFESTETPSPTAPRVLEASLTEAQQKIVDVLRDARGAVSVDEIIDRADVPAGQVLRELTLLSLRAVVRRTDVGGWTLARR